jgi:hypothetical protein
MEFTLGWIYFVLVVLALQIAVVRVCAGHAAMWAWRNYFRLAAIIWCAMPIAKKCYIDEILPPTDGLGHEMIAREVTALVKSGYYWEITSYFAIGNDAYRSILGVFYAVTGAPEVVTYAINGALGYLGLLTLLDVLCRHSQCRRLPPSVVLAISLLPSGILWTTANLKEGATLWGICSMLYFTAPAKAFAARPRRIVPFIGFACLAVMRPHIAAIWLAAIAAGATLQAQKVGTFLASTVAGLVVLAMLVAYVPDMVESAMGDGVSATLADRYSSLSSNDKLNGVALTGSTPLPVISGLTLIMFRPWPFEVREQVDLLVGLEVWALAAFGMLNWRAARGRWKIIMDPSVVTHIVALVALGFLFSYVYNMGLAVRQRLMCFPAVLFLYCYPILAMHGAKRLGVCKRTRGLRPLRVWRIAPHAPSSR